MKGEQEVPPDFLGRNFSTHEGLQRKRIRCISELRGLVLENYE
jgi:hypothetical protein